MSITLFRPQSLTGDKHLSCGGGLNFPSRPGSAGQNTIVKYRNDAGRYLGPTAAPESNLQQMPR